MRFPTTEGREVMTGLAQSASPVARAAECAMKDEAVEAVETVGQEFGAAV